MELNGIKHTSMWVTEEEKVVVDAMRAGADVNITLHRAMFEEAIRRTDELPRNLLSKRHVGDYTDCIFPFINIAAENEDGSIKLNYFVKTKKATDGNQ